MTQALSGDTSSLSSTKELKDVKKVALHRLYDPTSAKVLEKMEKLPLPQATHIKTSSGNISDFLQGRNTSAFLKKLQTATREV